MQTAPFDYRYEFPTGGTATQIYDSSKTLMNTYKGGVWQEALSALTFLPAASYQGTQGQFSTYGFEYWPSRDNDGYITWVVDGEKSWTITNAALAANAKVEIGPRLIPEEPMVRKTRLSPLHFSHRLAAVHNPQLWHVAWFPSAGLPAPRVPEQDALRLRPRLPTRRTRELGLRPKRSPDNQIHRRVRPTNSSFVYLLTCTF
jgi:hypothetical protein